MSLKDIIGQEKAVNILFALIKRQRVASSYLFCGEPGIGKKTAAINFAKALNCRETDFSLYSGHPPAPSLENGNQGRFDACDTCDSCRKIDRGVHPDFLLILSEERQIKINEIRMIDDALSFKPFEARKKIVIVDDADTMNISSANAFLKTLEEPPEESLIILVSSNPERLPGTIRSRCSRINFTPLSLESCRRVLEGKIPGEGLDFAARLSMGRPGLALSSDLMKEKEWFLILFRSMLKAEKDGWTSREEMDRWFELVLTLFRDMAVLKVTGESSKLINTDLYEYLDKLIKFTDLKVLIYLYSKLNVLREVMRFNLNKSITWNYTSSLLRKELAV